MTMKFKKLILTSKPFEYLTLSKERWFIWEKQKKRTPFVIGKFFPYFMFYRIGMNVIDHALQVAK